MKPNHFLIATAAILASGACNAEKAERSPTASSTPAEAVEPPADGDWSQVVAQTDKGGFRMGNPDAKVQLVEFGSMTCPHCAEFDETGMQPLVDKYVKNGQVGFEFRNYVRDPFDIAASLIARCNGGKSFFPLTRAMFESQQEWITKLQSAPPSQLEALQNLGPEKQFLEIAKIADLQKWAAMRGVPSGKSNACLTDQDAVNQLVQVNSDITSEYPEFRGTPSFVINGKMVENANTWQQLEPKIRGALGS